MSSEQALELYVRGCSDGPVQDHKHDLPRSLSEGPFAGIHDRSGTLPSLSSASQPGIAAQRDERDPDHACQQASWLFAFCSENAHVA